LIEFKDTKISVLRLWGTAWCSS